MKVRDVLGLGVATVAVLALPRNIGATGPRSERFPSREERVKLYMSNWYTPPCPGYEDGLLPYQINASSDDWPVVMVHNAVDQRNTTTFVFDSVIKPDQAFYFHLETIQDCAKEASENPRVADRIEMRFNMKMYCADAQETLATALNHVTLERNLEGRHVVPTLLQFGDLKYSHSHRFLDVPVLKKFRSGMTHNQLEFSTNRTCYDSKRYLPLNAHDLPHYQPIIWKLATSRHYRLLASVYRDDTPYRDKINMAVWRGQLTGSHSDGFDKNKNDLENCETLRRCRLVYKHAHSGLVYAKLTNTRKKIPKVLNGIEMVGPPVTIRKLLKYKAVIMLEGNDVASGLKWALLSQSVVLMPHPKHTSWAMEELLEPWVHYIPLNDNATDVEDRMRWIVDHDEEAQRIAERATLWMEDLVFHSDAMEDDRWIQEDIIRRYQAHFVEMR